MKKIAFLGLGVMGTGMTTRLLDAGFPVTVWNRNAARAEPLREKGAAIASSPREAAAGADVVIAMVADDSASRAVWTGKDGALAGAPTKGWCAKRRPTAPSGSATSVLSVLG